MQRRWHLNLMGEIQLTCGENAVARFATQKVAVLLAYLALRMPTAVSRELLIDMLWPDQDLDAARNSLSVALSSLRRQLEPPGYAAGSVLMADRSSVRLNSAALTTDLQEFERLLKAADDGSDMQADRLAQAIDLYRGEFAQGHYYDWILRERLRIQTLTVEALLRLVSIHETRGAFSEALQVAQQAVTLDPFCEPSQLAVIRLQVALGRPALALDAASRLERCFREEFGAEPSESTRRFLARLRQNPNSVLPADQSVDSAVQSVSAGDRRLSDQPPSATPTAGLSHVVVRTLPEPGDADKREAPSEPQQVPARTHRPEGASTVDLPLRLTRLFGRAQEIEQVAEMLCPQREEGYRLVTLTGSGGAGKTRLSQEVGATLATRFPGRICFVPLADLNDPASIPTAIRNALHVRTPSNAEPFEQALEALKQQPTLLILDNLEQLLHGDFLPGSVPSATDAAGIVYRLLTQAPTLTCLCTSRRRLGLEGERELRVAPLALPQDQSSVEELASVPSVELYLDRARAVRADFQLTPGNAATVALLCRRLEGVPLAIELAAAWVRTLPPRSMLERLENRLALPASRRQDVPARHRSLTAVLDWSYALLTPRQQHFFHRVGIFVGGWTLTAAEVVCDEPEAMEMTEGLLAASLAYEDAEGEEPRFRLLDTVRQYSLEHLIGSGERNATSRRFRDYYRDLTERSFDKLEGPRQKEWLELLAAEYPNLCSVLDQDAADLKGGEAGLCITAMLWRYWFTRGHLREGVARLTTALTHPEAARFANCRMLALLRCGNLLTHLMQYAEADVLYAEVSVLANQLGDTERKSAVLNNRAILQTHLGNYEEAERLGLQALELNRSYGQRNGEATNLGTLGVVSRQTGDLPTARQRLETCIAINRELGQRYLVAVNLLNLAQVHLLDSDQSSAIASLHECLELCEELAAGGLLVSALITLASHRSKALQTTEAARLYGAALGLRDRLDIPPASKDREQVEAEAHLDRISRHDPSSEAEFQAGRALARADMVAYALACTRP